MAALAAILPFLLGFSFLIGAGPHHPDFPWVVEMERRSAEHARAAGSPKILFVGGSSVRFALSAKSLEARVGRPVVNYGLHAGIGVDLIAEGAAGLIGPGDLVVLAPEWSNFRDEATLSKVEEMRADWQAMADREAGWRRLSPVKHAERTRRAAHRVQSVAQDAWRTLARRAYGRYAGWKEPASAAAAYEAAQYDEHGEARFARGDAAAPTKMKVSSDQPRLRELKLDGGRADRGLTALKEACDRRGATLRVAAPFRVSVPSWDEAVLRETERRWFEHARARGVEPLMGVGETLLPTEFGYDTDYHFNDAGVARMEERLVPALREAISAGDQASHRGTRPR